MKQEIDSIEERADQSSLRTTDHANRWIIGFALLLIGGVLLVRNLGGWQIERWWFVLLIIPAVGAFTTAWRRYHAPGNSQRNAVIRPAFIGIAFLLLAVILLFNLGWQMIMPLFLILVGVIAFLSRMLR